MLFARLGDGAIDRLGSALQDRLGRLQAPGQLTDQRLAERVLPAVLQATVHPRPRLTRHPQGFGKGATGDAGVHRGLDDLRDRAIGGWLVVSLPGRDHVTHRHPHAIDTHYAAGGDALAEAVPTVDHRQPGGIAWHEGDMRAALLVDTGDRDDMGEQRPRAVGLLAVEHGAVAVEADLCLEGGDVLATRFGKGVAEAVTLQDLGVIAALLFLAAGQAEIAEYAEVVLRQLAEGRIGSGDGRDHLAEGAVRHPCAPVRLWHADRPQTTFGEALQLLPGQAPLAITQGRLTGKILGQMLRHLDGFGVITDDMGSAPRRRQNLQRRG